MNPQAIAEKYKAQSIQFMRDLIQLPSTSSNEKLVAERILKEMATLNFDKQWIDDYGNVIGQIGRGPIKILFDSHIDTVGVGNPENWPYDPFAGKIEDGYIYGRGASDNYNGTVSQVYGAAISKVLGIDLDSITIYVVGTVQEEDCDGLALRYILEKSVGPVDFVCLGEATDLKVFRGHRGRMEMNVIASGVSCHGSAPERGVNAIYQMAPLVKEIEELNDRLIDDKFLGKGTCAVTHISCETPSVCAVPDACRIHIDRRLTQGEDQDLAVDQIKSLPSYQPETMRLEILNYDTPSYTGKILTTPKYFPTWVLEADHPLVLAGARAAQKALNKDPEISRWVFSTNGVSSMGQLAIPTIGFGPAREEDSHSIDDRVKIDDLLSAMIFYAHLPSELQNAK